MKVEKEDHTALVLWAANCAEHVLPLFEGKSPDDDRPRKAIEAGRAWARGEVTMSRARAAAFAAHAAARDVDDDAARVAARAAGHAAATAHVPTHAPHAATYAVAAVASAAKPIDAAQTATDERHWQHEQIAEHLWPMAFP